MKRNEMITFASGLAIFSILVLSILSSPIFRLVAEAQDGNQASSETVQEATAKAERTCTKVKELVQGAGVNISLAQGDNLTDQLRTLNESSEFRNLTQQLSQEFTNLGLNATNVRELALQSGASLEGLLDKLQNLSSSRGT